MLEEEALALLTAPAEGVDPRVDDQAARTPGGEGELSHPIEVALVEPHLLAEVLGVERPALDEGVLLGVLAEGGDLQQLLGDRQLEMMAGDRLVDRQDPRLEARPGLRAVGVDEVLAGLGSVGDGVPVVGDVGVGRLVVRDLPDHALGLGEDPEVVGDLGPGSGEPRLGRGEDRLAGAEVEALIAPQAAEDLGEVVGAEELLAERAHLLVDPLDLRHAGRVDLLRALGQRSVEADLRAIAGATLGEVDDPALRVRPRPVHQGAVDEAGELRQRRRHRLDRRGELFGEGPLLLRRPAGVARGERRHQGPLRQRLGQLPVEHLAHPPRRLLRRHPMGDQTVGEEGALGPDRRRDRPHPGDIEPPLLRGRHRLQLRQVVPMGDRVVRRREEPGLQMTGLAADLREQLRLEDPEGQLIALAERRRVDRPRVDQEAAERSPLGGDRLRADLRQTVVVVVDPEPGRLEGMTL